MPTNFLQYLIILLIILLFAKEYLPFILEKFGIKVKKNGNNGNDDKKLENILSAFAKNLDENHLAHFKQEIKEMLGEIKNDMKETRRDFENHAEQDARIQGEILGQLKK